MRARDARLVAVAAVALAAGVALPAISADVWAYAAYGALLAHGADPWAHAYRAAAVAPMHDAVLDAAVRAWDDSLPRDVYGPLFTLPCAAIVVATRAFGAGAAVLTLRVAASCALLACIALAARTRPRLAPLLALHPVALWAAAEGHNDALWLALLLAGDRARAFAPRAVALVAAAAVKAVAVVPLAYALACTPMRRRAAAAAASFVALALAYAPLLHGVLAHGFDRGGGPPRISLVHGAALAAWSGSPLPELIAAVLGVAGVAAVLRAWRARAFLSGATLAGWLLLPAPEPWYALWLLPVVAGVPRSPAATALLAASVTGAAGYVQDVVAGTVLADPALLGGTMLALYALPVILALAEPSPNPTAQPAPTAAPARAPSPVPSPASPTTPVPPTPAPSASPNPFAYVVTPSPAPPAGPRIVEIALNDRVLHQGGPLLVRVTTSSDVKTVVARTMGHEIAIPQGSPGYFAGQEQLPSGIPFFLLNRTYQIDFIATANDGKTTTVTVPIRLER